MSKPVVYRVCYIVAFAAALCGACLSLSTFLFELDLLVVGIYRGGIYRIVDHGTAMVQYAATVLAGSG